MELELTANRKQRQKQNHLERKWTFWFDIHWRPNSGTAWGVSLRRAYTFHTVQDFWVDGIEPKWEDPECENGGKWSVTCSDKEKHDAMWLETLLALIGEQFDESDEICGVVASVRPRQSKLALWTKTATNEATQMSIGRKWKETINSTEIISYVFHLDSRNEKSVTGRYKV